MTNEGRLLATLGGGRFEHDTGPVVVEKVVDHRPPEVKLAEGRRRARDLRKKLLDDPRRPV